MPSELILPESPNILLVYRHATPTAFNLAKKVAKWLTQKQCHLFYSAEQKKIPGTIQAKGIALKKMHLAIVFGGDGTYLHAIRILSGHQVPILGINQGSLGFLTPTRAEDIFAKLELTLQNKMLCSSRSMLEVELVKKNKKAKEHKLALNDVVIERGKLSQLINISISYDRNLLSEVKADGLIVASPTGSTAYNLAAGGPILHPKVSAFVVTAIAPHSLTNRPLIIPDSGKLTFKLVGNMHRAHLVLDGKEIAELTTEDEVAIRKSKHEHLMVMEPRHSYFQLLREKLKFGDRA